ncbi:MAG: hypothetical protein ACP59X_05090 [Solidesulfovibrio sp. DCME]|uniref:hypothetical protein n=1 Tax=Solidesulfovibrio sp. DCME TaxID=3447380 RepID=UPI003D132F15
MDFLVTVPGLPSFSFVPPHKETRGPQAPCHCGEACPKARRAGGCLALGAIDGVLDFFSDVVSYETALVLCHHGGRTAVYEETGQRAAARLLLAGMQRSGCPFFARFAALPADAPLGSAYTALGRLLAALAGGEAAPQPQGLSALEQLADEAEGHLAVVLGEAKRRCRRDAAVNAVILLCNGIRLATEAIREKQAAQASGPRRHHGPGKRPTAG